MEEDSFFYNINPQLVWTSDKMIKTNQVFLDMTLDQDNFLTRLGINHLKINSNKFYKSTYFENALCICVTGQS